MVESMYGRSARVESLVNKAFSGAVDQSSDDNLFEGLSPAKSDYVERVFKQG